MTHTPGPWSANKSIDGPTWIGGDETGNTGFQHEIASMIHENEANARLIAAAPDLLEALQVWLQFWDEMPKGQLGNIVCDIGLLNDGFIKSGKAIKKAIGEPKS